MKGYIHGVKASVGQLQSSQQKSFSRLEQSLDTLLSRGNDGHGGPSNEARRVAPPKPVSVDLSERPDG
eukprot:7318328-Karenia_brevis.AAC.1